jgi:hypothetical protein
MSPIERQQMFAAAAGSLIPVRGWELPRPEDANLGASQMIRPSADPLFGSEFAPFLYAAVEEDTNGTVLSVLSALARLDVDPWEEASRLAQLPRDIATLELTTLIAPLCDGRSEHRDPKAIVPRLIALLPRLAAADVSHKTLHDIGALHFPRVSFTTLYLVFLVMLLLLGQMFISTHQIDKAPTRTPSTGSTPSTPPNGNR